VPSSTKLRVTIYRRDSQFKIGNHLDYKRVSVRVTNIKVLVSV